MVDLEIETLRLRLPGVNRERAGAVAEHVGTALRDRISHLMSPPIERLERLRIQLDVSVAAKETEVVDRVVETIAQKIQLK